MISCNGNRHKDIVIEKKDSEESLNQEASKNFINDLTEYEWYMSSFNKNDNNWSAKDKLLSLKFNKSGQFDAVFCNTLNGNYTYDPEKNSITLSNIVRTKKLCNDKTAIEAEKNFSHETYTASITKGILQLDNKEMSYFFYRNAGNENQMSDEWDNYDKQPVYIVIFKEKTSLEKVKDIISKYKLKEKSLYNLGDDFRGFAAPMPTFVIEQIKKEKDVKYVEVDKVYNVNSLKNDTLKKCDINKIRIKNSKKTTIQQGVWGTVSFMEGDFMPTFNKDNPKNSHCPVERTVRVYELTYKKNAIDIDRSYKQYKSTKLLKEIKTDYEGFFQIDLPPGKYSIFIIENGKLYNNSIELKNGDINKEILGPMEIKKGIQEYNIQISHNASF